MKNKFRLDKYALPEKYEIFIEPDLENEKFIGNETIHLEINKPTKQIKLNTIGLKITNPKLLDSNKSEYIPEIKFDEELKWLSLILIKKSEQVTFHFI